MEYAGASGNVGVEDKDSVSSLDTNGKKKRKKRNSQCFH